MDLSRQVCFKNSFGINAAFHVFDFVLLRLLSSPWLRFNFFQQSCQCYGKKYLSHFLKTIKSVRLNCILEKKEFFFSLCYTDKGNLAKYLEFEQLEIWMKQFKCFTHTSTNNKRRKIQTFQKFVCQWRHRHYLILIHKTSTIYFRQFLY